MPAGYDRPADTAPRRQRSRRIWSAPAGSQFPAFGNVPDTSVTAVLFADGHRARAYVDVSDTGRVSRTRIEGDVGLFGLRIYPVVTSALVRDPRAVGVERIHLLYTHLVDEVGDDTTVVRGFFNAASILPESQGGNGDQVDLLFINPFNDPAVTGAVLAHEFQHLLSFHQHVLVRNGLPEENWLNEGLSLLCEDLVGAHELHNRQNIERFLANPHGTPLRGSVDNPAVRGAAYLFVRQPHRRFRHEILPRLVQTSHVGLRNVREAANDRITDIYERFLSRLYLSGSGFNPALEYTTPFLADTTSGARRFPLPTEFPSLRRRPPDREPSNPFPQLFCDCRTARPQPYGFKPTPRVLPGCSSSPFRLATKPASRFPPISSGISLDAPVSGPFQSYKPIQVSGAVSDTSISEIEFTLLLEDFGRRNRYVVPIRDEKFRQTFFFSHEQAGDYRLRVGTRRQAQQDFDPAGTFGVFTIAEGPEKSPLPTSYFTDIVFSSPVPVEVRTGQALQISGAVSDTTLTAINLSFWHEDIDRSVHFEAPVIERHFSKTVLFTHAQSGVHQLAINRQRGNTNYALPQDSFRPFVVIQGAGPVLLPVDFFQGIRLDAPMPIEYRIGHPVRVDGATSDPSVSQIEFSFFTFGGDDTSPSGRSDTQFVAPVVNGRFSTDIAFSREQQVSDAYTLDVRLWKNGERSAGFRTFEPVSIEAAVFADFNGDGTVGFADFVAFSEAFGRTSADADFDPKFDLDGDDAIGLGDFVIFARAFGQ